MTTFSPPICTKKLAWPMNVTPISPFETSFGLCDWPWRGVTAECRISLPNALARLRNAGFCSACLSIGGAGHQLLAISSNPASRDLAMSHELTANGCFLILSTRHHLLDRRRL